MLVENPVLEAAVVRRKMAEAVKEGRIFTLKLAPEVAACLLGVTAEVAGELGMLFIDSSLVVAESREVALQAFGFWQDGLDREMGADFCAWAYPGLYRMFQRYLIGQLGARGKWSEEDCFLIDVLRRGNWGVEEVLGDRERETFRGAEELLEKVLGDLWERMGRGEQLRQWGNRPENLHAVEG